ncbi:MAG: TetR family transcriptional regulator [Candidatus Dadabacteria bacterium CSP1-2]|mgnify:CR=1 FL=1|jgi:AcrR family transcriptional regulator|nr:MAG: TetR family transcriptional regulator [Candidatus Dadabacteria bacterium CSP1-2]
MSSEQIKISTRDKILESAIRLFAEKGFSGTTTREIAEKAGVNEALIFRYFSTKRDLYSAIIERKISEEPGFEYPLEAFKETRDDWLIFRSIAIRMFDCVEKDPSFIRLLHFSALEGHELSDMFFDTYVQYQRMLLSDYIERRISEGAFKNVNPVLAARAFIGMVINYILVQEIFGEKKRRKIKREEVADTFVKIFLEGIKNN